MFPADTSLHPGERGEFKAVGFDAGGRPLGELKVDWSLAGMRLPEGIPPPPPGTPAAGALQGKLSDMSGSATTKLTVAPAPPPGQFGRVLGTLPGGKIVGEGACASCRPCPTGPTSARFPRDVRRVDTSNTQGKFGIVKLADGSFALKKLAVNPSPLVARANAFIDLPTTKDYTIQADVMGTKVGGDLADAGVVANRYTLMFFGNNKLLRLVSWDALAAHREEHPDGVQAGHLVQHEADRRGEGREGARAR